MNESKTVQREMFVCDDQRMVCHMGLARVMGKLGLLRASTMGTNKGSAFSLGHGKPRKQYVLACDKKVLQQVIKDFGHIHIAVDGVLTNNLLFGMVDQTIALFANGLQSSLPQCQASYTWHAKSPHRVHQLLQHTHWPHSPHRGCQMVRNPHWPQGGKPIRYHTTCCTTRANVCTG